MKQIANQIAKTAKRNYSRKLYIGGDFKSIEKGLKKSDKQFEKQILKDIKKNEKLQARDFERQMKELERIDIKESKNAAKEYSRQEKEFLKFQKEQEKISKRQEREVRKAEKAAKFQNQISQSDFQQFEDLRIRAKGEIEKMISHYEKIKGEYDLTKSEQKHLTQLKRELTFIDRDIKQITNKKQFFSKVNKFKRILTSDISIMVPETERELKAFEDVFSKSRFKDIDKDIYNEFMEEINKMEPIKRHKFLKEHIEYLTDYYSDSLADIEIIDNGQLEDIISQLTNQMKGNEENIKGLEGYNRYSPRKQQEIAIKFEEENLDFLELEY